MRGLGGGGGSGHGVLQGRLADGDDLHRPDVGRPRKKPDALDVVVVVVVGTVTAQQALVLARYAPAKCQDETNVREVAQVDLLVVEERGNTEAKRADVDASGVDVAAALHLRLRVRHARTPPQDVEENNGECVCRTSDPAEVTEVERVLIEPA